MGSVACGHGTFVAGILGSRRGSGAPAICPGCTLLVRPVFAESIPEGGRMPATSPAELASAIVACIAAGARVINLSLGLARVSGRGERELAGTLDRAMDRGVIVVAAGGNQGTLGSTAITGHPWVIPVAACDLRGRPAAGSNLGASIGCRGLLAPGEGIMSLGSVGPLLPSGGTSVATPFVTGAIGLLWSEFPRAGVASMKLAVTGAFGPRRNSVVPALLDAWSAYRILANS